MLGERIIHGINLQRLGARLSLAAVLSAGFTAAVAAPPVWAQSAQEPAGQSQGRSDADIQSDVAYALSHSKSLQGQHITAATVEGDVTVSGYVRDEASKELAESLIYRVNGVRSVTNNLTVGDAPQATAANAQGTDANTTPEQDLNYDPAQQNMAPAGGQEQAQSAPAPDQQAYTPPPPPPSNDSPQYSGQQQPYPQQPYGQQPTYGQQQYHQQPLTPVTIPSGTLLQVRTSEPLDATRVQPGPGLPGDGGRRCLPGRSAGAAARRCDHR